MRIIEYTKITPEEITEFRQTSFPDPNTLEWRGVTVFGEFRSDGSLHPMIPTLMAKAHELAAASDDKTQLLLIGTGLVETARQYYAWGADRIFVYDDPSLAHSGPDQNTAILAHFIDNYKPEAMLIADTPMGKILAANILEYAGSTGKELTIQTIEEKPLPLVVDPSHLGELLICEIP